jgi:predicted Rossmann-fold nucleotide-binding protein
VRRTRGRTVDVTTLADLERRLDEGVRSLSGWRVRHLDLRGRPDLLQDRDVDGATFLGCDFAGDDATRAEAGGAIVLPSLADRPLPVDPARTSLYTAPELYDAPRWVDSLDGRAYAWSQEARADVAPGEAALARVLHDHAIDVALDAWRLGRRVVGVMGGHRALRGEETYADAARLGHLLGDRLTVATGGGPGAMEAANLGARLAGEPAEALAEALSLLAAVPTYRPSVDAWVSSAMEVRERWPDARENLAIPTWHYGHEPPGVFATAIAKYFRNATRESILLEVCDAGIVFLPGAAGTVQEVFQDACENYYADVSGVAPMVLVGVEHWTRTLPAWPLLEALARDRAMQRFVHLVDTVEEAAELLA